MHTVEQYPVESLVYIVINVACSQIELVFAISTIVFRRIMTMNCCNQNAT